MSTDPTGQPTEDELRAAYEAEIKKIRVEQMLLENIVTLVNLGMRRTGLAPGTEDERDQTQVRIAIEAVRALLPLVEQAAPSQANAIRDAVSQLQLAYVRIGGQRRRPISRLGSLAALRPRAGPGPAGRRGMRAGLGRRAVRAALGRRRVSPHLTRKSRANPARPSEAAGSGSLVSNSPSEHPAPPPARLRRDYFPGLRSHIRVVALL